MLTELLSPSQDSPESRLINVIIKVPSLALYEPFQDAKQNKQRDYVCANAVHVEGGIDLTMSDSIRAQCMSSRLIHQKCTLTLLSSMSSSEPPSIPTGEQTGDMGFVHQSEQFVSGSDWKSPNRPVKLLECIHTDRRTQTSAYSESFTRWLRNILCQQCMRKLSSSSLFKLLRGISNFQPKSLP